MLVVVVVVVPRLRKAWRKNRRRRMLAAVMTAVLAMQEETAWGQGLRLRTPLLPLRPRASGRGRAEPRASRRRAQRMTGRPMKQKRRHGRWRMGMRGTKEALGERVVLE